MYEQTHNDLKEIILLLKNDGQKHWAVFLGKALVAFEQGSYQSCADIILSGSGGMGSLNDLILGQCSNSIGELQWKQGYKDINDLYLTLLDKLYLFAHGIRRLKSKNNSKISY